MIARLKNERDEARELLLKTERQAPAAGTAPAITPATVSSNGKRGLQLQYFDFSPHKHRIYPSSVYILCTPSMELVSSVVNLVSIFVCPVCSISNHSVYPLGSISSLIVLHTFAYFYFGRLV